MPYVLKPDATMLLDMLEVSTVQKLMQAFAEANDIAAGVFTPEPDFRRVGPPVHHSKYCQLIYSEDPRDKKPGLQPKGLEACLACDKKHMPRGSGRVKPYGCHAGLVDFAVPIVATKDGRRVLIGAIFAGQLRMKPEVTARDIRRIKKAAERYGINEDRLLAAYAERPCFDEDRVRRIQDLMQALADTIGEMATRRYEQHRLMQRLSALSSPAEVVRAIGDFMGADACSLFTESLGVPDRIYLKATSYQPLATAAGKVFYRRNEGLTGWVYSHGMTLNVFDVHDAGALRKKAPDLSWAHKVLDVPDAGAIHSYIGVPIKSEDGRTVGVIRAVRRGQGEFPPMQQETFEAIADIASAVIERLAAAERTRAILRVATDVLSNVDLEQVVVSAVREGMLLFGLVADNVWVTRYLTSSREFQILGCRRDSPDYHTWRGKTFPRSDGIGGYLLEKHQPFMSNDLEADDISSVVPSVKACIGYPLVFEDEFLGILVVASGRTNVFREEHLEELKLLGRQVTLAFHNAEQYEQSRIELHNKYAHCLNAIANLPLPWTPRSLVERAAEALNGVGFHDVRAFVADAAGTLRCVKAWSGGRARVGQHRHIGSVYDHRGAARTSYTRSVRIRESDGKETGVIEVSRVDVSGPLSESDKIYLDLAGEILSSRLRTEQQFATAIHASVLSSSHVLGQLVVTPRDIIDSILHGDDPSLGVAPKAREELSVCLHRINQALEWAETSMLLVDYRRGLLPDVSDFEECNFRQEFAEALELTTVRHLLSVRSKVPAATLVKIHRPAFRRIIRDVAMNAVEHGKKGPGVRRAAVRASVARQADGSWVEIAISNATDTFDSARAKEMGELARMPENMPLGQRYGLGTILAAVIAKMHGRPLKVRVRRSRVTFSLSVQASGRPRSLRHRSAVDNIPDKRS